MIDVFLLRALVTASTKPMIAEVIIHEPVDTTKDRSLRDRVPQRPKPFPERILVVGSDVLEDLHVIFAYKRMCVKG
ncbi:MAG: hypothetical protein ACREYE_05510 [Gammaproteobacteria bacterium]